MFYDLFKSPATFLLTWAIVVGSKCNLRNKSSVQFSSTLGPEVSCLKAGHCVNPWLTIVCGASGQAWQNPPASHGQGNAEGAGDGRSHFPVSQVLSRGALVVQFAARME